MGLEELGIKLILDEGSIQVVEGSLKNVAKESSDIYAKAMQEVENEIQRNKINEAKKDVRKQVGVTAKGEKSPGTMALIGGAIGGALGGIFGQLISYIKPIGQFLEVIGAVLSVGLSPLLPILKMFLVFALDIFKRLKKWLTMAIEGLTNVSKEDQSAPASGQVGFDSSNFRGAGGLMEGVKTWFDGIIEGLKSWDFLGIFKDSISNIIMGIGDFIIGIMDIFAGIIDVFIGLFTGDWELFWQGFKEIWNGILEVFWGVMEFIAGVIATIILFFIDSWNKTKELFSKAWGYLKDFGAWVWDSLTSVFSKSWEAIKDFGQWIWDSLTGIFTRAFSVLEGIGSWLWDTITGWFGGGGGDSTSVDDALITSSGDIVKFNPNDNLVAVQDLGTLGKLGGGSSGQQINIKVEGYVGDENELAYRIGKAMQNYSRGSATQW